MATQIQLRRDTAANWTATNPVLAQGEPGYETDTGKLKVGNGSSAWNSLSYQAAAAIVDGTIVNADVASNAAIDGTKISPDFGAQNVTTTGTSTAASYNPTSSTAPTNGIYLPAANSVGISTTADGASSPTERMRIKSDGQTYWVADTPSTTSYGTSIGRGGLAGLFETARNGGAASSVANFSGNAGSAVVFGDGDLENTNGRYTAFSDIRFKQNIEDSASQWDDLKAIRIRKYELKANPDRKHIGVVAQELEQVCPGLVIERENTDGETYKSVAYSVLYTKAVKALQEAMERIEQLEAKVAALEAQ